MRLDPAIQKQSPGRRLDDRSEGLDAAAEPLGDTALKRLGNKASSPPSPPRFRQTSCKQARAKPSGNKVLSGLFSADPDSVMCCNASGPGEAVGLKDGPARRASADLKHMTVSRSGDFGASSLALNPVMFVKSLWSQAVTHRPLNLQSRPTHAEGRLRWVRNSRWPAPVELYCQVFSNT